MIIYSFNGSGKTLSFMIPVLNTINYLIPHSTYKTTTTGGVKQDILICQPQAVIIVPTEALMEQTVNYLT